MSGSALFVLIFCRLAHRSVEMPRQKWKKVGNLADFQEWVENNKHPDCNQNSSGSAFQSASLFWF